MFLNVAKADSIKLLSGKFVNPTNWSVVAL